MNLCPKHDGCEGEKEEALEAEEDHEDDSDRWTEAAAICPLPPDTGEEMEATKNEGVQRD